MVGVVKYFHLLGVLSALIFILWGCCPMVLLSILAFLCPPTWPHDENVDRPHLYHVITWPEMGSYTLMVGVVKYFHLLGVLSALIFILWIYCPMVLLSNFSFLCPPTWLHDENVDRPHLYHVITWPKMGSYTLMVGVVKYFHLLGVLSALIFILWLLSYGAFVHFSFLCPPTWPHDENVDRPHLYHVITWPEMGSYTLMVGVVKYFHLLGVLSALIFILWGCCPMVLLSILAFLCLPTWPHDHITRDLIVHLDGWSSKIFSWGFCPPWFLLLWGCCPMVLLSILGFLCPPTWPHDENVDRPHLYHVITWPEMGSYTLMVGVVKYFHLLGVLSALIFILWGCCPMVLLSILAFLCPPTWPHDENVDRPHLYRDHMTRDGSYTLMVGVVKYFHLLGVLSALIFILWGCCPMVLLSILAFLCPPTWPHDENVDRPHLYHVITWPEMGSYTLMVGVVKYFHLLGVLSALIFILWGYCPMVLLSNFSFLCPPTWLHDENVDRPHLYHVITWPEMGSYTLMVGVVKYFHLLGVLSALIFILWGCCPMVLLSIFLFSVRPRDCMTRMLIVHTCIMWSHDQRWDRTPWWLE